MRFDLSKNLRTYVWLHVDDTFKTSTHQEEIERFHEILQLKFKVIIDKEVLAYLGINLEHRSVGPIKLTQLQHLIVHKRIHTNEKPYQCEQCEYKSTDSSHLSRHKRIHTGEKPFQCNHCEYKCSDPSAFRIHKRTHTEEKPYECYFKCTTSSNLINEYIQ